MTKGLMEEMRECLEKNENILARLRGMTGLAGNTPEAILVSYDLQAGSYTRNLGDDRFRAVKEAYSANLAKVIDALPHASLLEAGVGEATTLAALAPRLAVRPARTFGFDISWSRLAVATRHAASQGVAAQFFTGALERIPAPDDAFELVYTSHSIEPNTGREKEILRELMRVTRNHLVLVEPSYELGSEATRAHIQRHGYVTNLLGAARELGLNLLTHRLFEPNVNPNNQAALMVFEKTAARTPDPERQTACPACGQGLETIRGHCFCHKCHLLYPVIEGIPCLLAGNGILASGFPASLPPEPLA